MKSVLKSAICIVLLAVMCVALVSCGGVKPNEDPDKVVAALEAAGYEDVSKRSTGFSYLGVGGIEWRVSGIIMEPKCEWIEVYYFKSATDADEAWPKMQKEADSWFSLPENYGSEFVCEKSGHMIWFGTKNAVEVVK